MNFRIDVPHVYENIIHGLVFELWKNNSINNRKQVVAMSSALTLYIQSLNFKSHYMSLSVQLVIYHYASVILFNQIRFYSKRIKKNRVFLNKKKNIEMEERGEALNSIYKPFPPRLKSYITFFFNQILQEWQNSLLQICVRHYSWRKKFKKRRKKEDGTYTYTACPHHFGESNIDYVVYSERLVHARICDIFI